MAGNQTNMKAAAIFVGAWLLTIALCLGLGVVAGAQLFDSSMTPWSVIGLCAGMLVGVGAVEVLS